MPLFLNSPNRKTNIFLYKISGQNAVYVSWLHEKSKKVIKFIDLFATLALCLC
jgi:hypothetical protein